MNPDRDESTPIRNKLEYAMEQQFQKIKTKNRNRMRNYLVSFR